MKKRFIALLLCCVMIFTLSPSLISSAAADDDANGTTVETPAEPKAEDSTVEEPKIEEPKIEEPKIEEPKIEEPKTEEPKTEEPKTEEPKTEEPKAEEPKAEDETTIPAAEQPGAPVESEIITPTVNFTNVAPFLPPVSGGVRMLRAPLAARAAANFAANDAANDTATDSGMKISKTAKANGDGSYTITLEAYATGEKVTTVVTEDIPTDIVLVLDQSGSMDETMSTYDFREYTNWSNSYLYNRRHNNNGNNGNLYYKLDDGSYATVSVSRALGESTYTYTPCPSDWQNDRKGSYGDWNPDDYWKYSENLYVKVGEEYQKVTLTRNRDYPWEDYTYTYTFPDNSTFVSVRENASPGNFDGKGPLYYRSETAGEYTYTYTYTDADGVPQTIGSSTGANIIPTGFTLYERYSTGSVTRLNALKSAVTTFANSVAEKAKGKDGELGTTDDVNHRVAVVGFASRSGYGNNTELLSISGSNSGSVGVAYNSITSQNLKDVLQDMSTQPGQDMVTSAINALAAQGATQVDLGMDMAQRVLAANPVPEGQQRNRVVVVFTDGAPTTYDGFDKTVANNAISKANTIKTGGTTVYSVGIFPGADPTSSGTEPSGNLNNNSSSIPAASNWFMQKLSSNNGTPQTPSYYLSAADADTLKNIFKQISDNIESGGSSTTLDENAVIKDIISPQFTLPAGATASNITLESYNYNGPSYNTANAWTKNATAMGAEATIEGSQVSVTGFDFAENWCGSKTNADGSTTYQGNKLVISFKVQPKAGFLGGNNVYTNGSAGIYENGSAQTPVMTFNQPQVNVPIENVTVTATDKNVYLLGGLTAEQLKSGAEVKCGDVTLDLSKASENYGLEAWQTAYVNITVKLYGADGRTEITGLTDLTDDTTYTISVTVAPKNEALGTSSGTPATAKTGANDPAKINVFKPELTFQDSEVYYGETLNGYDTLTSTEWKHGNIKSTDNNVVMIGTAPQLDITYSPGAGKINTKQDIAVDVTVKIGNTDVTTDTTFKHTACTGKTCTVPTGKEFLLHVKTCSLTITKTGGNANEPYVFTVFKDNEKYSEVTVMGGGSETICELPVGTYTIVEDTGWSWRYPNPTYSPIAGVTLSKTGASGTITCTNSLSKPYWLNGFSAIVKNIYGVQH